MSKESKLQEYLRKLAAGEVEKDEKWSMPLPDFGKQSTGWESFWGELEKTLQEIAKRLRSDAEAETLEKESKYLLKIATRLPGRTIPVHNGKATISVEVLPKVLQNLVSKGYLKEGPDGYVVTDEGLAMADGTV